MKHRIFALLPFFVFVVIFAGAGIISKDFYSMPAYVAFLIALFIGFLQNKKLSFNDKLEVVARGAGDVNIITMVLIFLVAGAFSGMVTARLYVLGALPFNQAGLRGLLRAVPL